MHKQQHSSLCLGAAGLGLLLAISPSGCGQQESPEEVVASIGTTYQVGPGKTFADLQSVASRLQPGDVVEVYAKGSAYAGGLVLDQPGTSASKITIRGIAVNGQ